MMKWLRGGLVLMGMLAVLAGHGAMVTRSISTQVLRQDGTPAAGARVVLRVYDFEQKKTVQLATVTDAQGQFHLDYPSNADPNIANDSVGIDGCYLMVDIPAGPLVFRRPTGQRINPIKAEAGKMYCGTVVDAGNHPIGGARAIVNSLYSPRIWGVYATVNDGNDGIATPEMEAISDTDGTFHTRFVDLGDVLPYIALMHIEAKVGNAWQAGQVMATPGQPSTITLSPCPTITGLVRNGKTGKPLSGARVKLVPCNLTNPDMGLAPAITDADGRFTFTNAVDERHGWAVDVSCKEFGDHWERVQEHAAEVELLPLITVTGDVRDDQHRIPAGHLTVQTCYQGECGNGDETFIGRKYARATMQPDGTFTLCMPDQPDLHATIGSFGYRGAGAEIERGKALHLLVNREAGVLVKITDVPDELIKDITCGQTAKGDRGQYQFVHGQDGYFFIRRNRQETEADLIFGIAGRNGGELLSWQTVNLTQPEWPLVISAGKTWSQITLSFMTADGKPRNAAQAVRFYHPGSERPAFVYQPNATATSYQGQVPPGKYTITTGEGLGAELRTVTLTPGTQTLEWLPPASASVTLNFTLPAEAVGQPVPYVNITRLAGETPIGIPVEKYPRKNGEVITGLCEGDYRFDTLFQRKTISTVTQHLTAGENTVSLSWPGTATLLLSLNTTPPVDTWSIELHYVVDGKALPDFIGYSTVDKTVKYERLPAGTYELRCSYNRGPVVKATFDLMPGQNTQPLPPPPAGK